MSRTGRLLALWVCLAACAGGACRSDESPPSILLVVVDTLRMDAVSAYGFVSDTTPTIDALAERGLLYERAYAPSPWTLPSHATLFTGLGVEEHGVGVRGGVVLPDQVVTLAERLSAAGYETAGFAENLLISEHFNMQQGFEHFSSATPEMLYVAQSLRQTPNFDVRHEVDAWLRKRKGDRPSFVFVNLLDPHEPYVVLEQNRFLPQGTGVAEARRVSAGDKLSHRICGALPSRQELEVLRGLYLGEAATSDAKLRVIREFLQEAEPSRPLITVVTADHGEHLGEHRLLDHEFSVHDVVLHVPLVVHGLAGAAPASIRTPVALADLAPAILDWAQVPVPEELAQRPTLPTAASEEPAGDEDGARDLFAVYTDGKLRMPETMQVAPDNEESRDRKRKRCAPRDRVFGDMASLTRYPFKMIWFERYASALYDLSRDPGERIDLTAALEDRARVMRAALERYTATALTPDTAGTTGTATPDVSEEGIEALRALGYVE